METAYSSQSGADGKVMVDHRHQVPGQLNIKLHVVCSLEKHASHRTGLKAAVFSHMCSSSLEGCDSVFSS